MLVHNEENVRKGGVEIMVETDCNKSSIKDEDFKIKDESEAFKEDIASDIIESNIDKNEDSEKEVEEKRVKKRGRKRKILDTNKDNTEPNKKLVKKYTKRKGKFFVNLKYCFLGV